MAGRGRRGSRYAPGCPPGSRPPGRRRGSGRSRGRPPSPWSPARGRPLPGRCRAARSARRRPRAHRRTGRRPGPRSPACPAPVIRIRWPVSIPGARRRPTFALAPRVRLPHNARRAARRSGRRRRTWGPGLNELPEGGATHLLDAPGAGAGVAGADRRPRLRAVAAAALAQRDRLEADLASDPREDLGERDLDLHPDVAARAGPERRPPKRSANRSRRRRRRTRGCPPCCPRCGATSLRTAGPGDRRRRRCGDARDPRGPRTPRPPA